MSADRGPAARLGSKAASSSSRRRRAGAAAGLLVTAALASCDRPAPIPTYEVVRRDFVHRVTAEGFLRSTEVAAVQVPANAPPGARVLWRAEDGIRVEEGDVVALLDRVEMERRLERERVDLASAEVRLDQTRVEGAARVGEVGTRKEVAGLELEHAEKFRREDGRLYSRREIVQSQIDEQLARVRQDRAGEIQRLQRDLAETELSLVDVDRRRAADEVARARRALAALEIRAPQGGLLAWVRNERGDLPQIGEQVWRGQTLAEIPRSSQLALEVYVVEADVGGIAPGLEALVTVDARPEVSHRARVTWVDPIAKPRFRGSPVQYFAVVLALERNDPSVKSGQRATASILVEEVEDALVVPRQALFSEEGVYVVHRAVDDAFERTPVQVSALARGLAVVDSGLEPGSRVALAAPGGEPPRGGLRRVVAALRGEG